MKRIATYRYEDAPAPWYCFRVFDVDDGGRIRTIYHEQILSEPTNKRLIDAIASLKEVAMQLDATVIRVDELLEDLRDCDEPPEITTQPWEMQYLELVYAKELNILEKRIIDLKLSVNPKSRQYEPNPEKRHLIEIEIKALAEQRESLISLHQTSRERLRLMLSVQGKTNE